MTSPWARFRGKIVDARPDELRALALAFAFNFVVLGSYYVVRPIRDDIGAAGGLDNLPWMYTGTLAAMLVANALFSAIVARMSRRKFIPIAYRFFIANLALFYLLMRTSPLNIWVGRAFFVWVSVFNLFVVTVFWAFMTDIFNSDQGKRLFGFISVGGTLGGIVGGIFTAALVKKIGAVNLLIVSAAMLEAGAWCVRFFPGDFRRDCRASVSDADAQSPLANGVSQKRPTTDATAEQPIGGGIISGISHVFRSPYLLGICAFVLLYAISSTLVYFQQADITAHQFHDRAARTAFFGWLDVSVNMVTLIVQLFLTGRLLKWFGVGLTLAFLPLLSMIGFLAMGFMPVLALLALFQTLRRAGNFAITRPAREVLFTVLRREDKYKAKSFIDTFVYRAGDQIGAWSYPLFTWLGLGMTGISFVAAPLAAGWCLISLWLGRQQHSLAQPRAGDGVLSDAPAR
ncbi:MAG: MFS transporter [Chthoniobacterales bacterium]|nr:MFS transporter [Chthoniobacterales bacterium]